MQTDRRIDRQSDEWRYRLRRLDRLGRGEKRQTETKKQREMERKPDYIY